MRQKSLFTLALCLVLGFGVFAQKVDLSKEMKLDGTVRYGKLSNGMTYYIKSNKKPENRIEFRLAVNAGSVLETEDQRGLAHFTEHMAFNGTKHYPGNELTNALQKEGITFGRDDNAYTSFDETVYELSLPNDPSRPELVEMGFKVMDGWASAMLMVGKEIDAERGVIIEEWRGNRGAGDRLRTKTWPIILKGSKYADRLPIGTLENLQTFPYSSIRNFYKTWYRPDNQAVIIVGDFDADEMEQKVKDYFEMTFTPSTPLERPEFTIPDNDEPLIAVATDKEYTSTDIVVLYKHPAAPMKTVGDFRNKELLVNIFEHMLNNRLQEMTSKKACPFLSAGCGYTPTFIARNVGGYIFQVSAKDGKALDALKAVMTENQRVLQHGFLATELNRAKESVLDMYDRAAKEANKTNSDVYASQYVSNFLHQTPIVGARQEYRWAKSLIEDITLEEVNALLKEWISDKNIIAYVNMPEKKGLKVPTADQIKKILTDTYKTTPYVDTYKDVPFLASEPKSGKIVSTEVNKDFDFTTLKLSNGATVVLKSTTLKDNQILFNAWSKGGSSLYPDNKMMNVTMAAGMIDACGIGNYDNNQLQKFLAGKTIGITPYIGELEEGFNGSCAPKDLETFMQYLYMYYTAPRKDKEVFEAKVSALLSQIASLQNSPDVAFSLQMQKSMYPNDKRSIQIPTEKQIKSMNIDEMYKIFQERFSDASDFTFEFVGNFNMDEIKPLIEKYIASLPSQNGKKAENWKDVSAKFAKGVVDDKVYKGTEDKSTMVIALRKDYTWGQKENRVIDVLNEILQIKVTEKIREELGATYSPYMGISYEKLPTPEFSLMAYYSIAPENETKVIDATWEILDNMINEGTTDTYLSKAKEQLCTRREKATAENGYWAGLIRGHLTYGTPLTTVDQYKAMVNSVTLDDVKAAAAKYLTHKEYVKVTSYPESMKK